MKLYFPTTSLNFNDLLSSECLSPPSFYNSRKYGTKRHFKTEYSLDDNFVFLFSSLPWFELTAQYPNSQLEEYPLIVEFESENLLSKIYKISDEIYAVPETIYFNKESVKFNFFSETHAKMLLAKTGVVEEVKLTNKYRSNFKTLNTESLKKIPTKDLILPHPDTSILKSEQLKDNKFNSIKGFLHAYTVKQYEDAINNPHTTLLAKFDDLIAELKKELNSSDSHFLQISKEQLISSKKYYEMNQSMDKIKSVSPPLTLHFKKIDGDHVQFDCSDLAEERETLFFNELVKCLLRVDFSGTPLSQKSIKELISSLNIFLEKDLTVFSSYIEDIHKIKKRFLEKNYEFKIKTLEHELTKNLYAFLLKGNKLEELEIVIADNDIQKTFILYGLLGLTSGYSDMSRFITQPLYQNVQLTEALDKQTMEIYKKIWHKDSWKSSYFEKSENNFLNISLFPQEDNALDHMQVDCSINELIQKIRESKRITKFLKRKESLSYDTFQVTFKETTESIIITFLLNETLTIELRKKNALKADELEKFKNHLKTLGCNNQNPSRIAQGNYPVFNFFKLKNDEKQILSTDNKQELLECLKLLVQ